MKTTRRDMPSARLLDVKAVAGLLECSPRTVQRMADRGEVPGRIHLGLRLIRWDSHVIHAWIGNGCVATPAREVSDEG